MGKRGRAWKLERAHVGGECNRSNKYSNSDASPTPEPGTQSRYWVGSYTRKDGTKVKGHYRKNPYYKGN